MKKCVLTLAAACCLWGWAQAQDSATTDADAVHSSPAHAGTSGGAGMLSDSLATQIESTSARQARGNGVYRIKPAVDIPLTAALTAWTLYGFSQAYNKEPSPQETVFDRNNVPKFDRWATRVYKEKVAKISDLPFYGSMPLPFLLLLDRHIRKDAAKIGLLYLETMSVTGTLYTGATTFVDRYRPYVYNPNVSPGDRTDGNAKNSFFAGHVALVGTATFFTAKVHADYHPGSKWNKWFFAGAGLATAATGYMRHLAGRHFPSDILLGTAIGIADGILIPHWHKNKQFRNENLSIIPFTGRSHGLLLTYRFQPKKQAPKDNVLL